MAKKSKRLLGFVLALALICAGLVAQAESDVKKVNGFLVPMICEVEGFSVATAMLSAETRAFFAFAVLSDCNGDLDEFDISQTGTVYVATFPKEKDQIGVIAFMEERAWLIAVSTTTKITLATKISVSKETASMPVFLMDALVEKGTYQYYKEVPLKDLLKAGETLVGAISD